MQSQVRVPGMAMPWAWLLDLQRANPTSSMSRQVYATVGILSSFEELDMVSMGCSQHEIGW
jgi:hypothetical protein